MANEQGMLPSFDPLSILANQIYVLHRAEDAYDNAAVALNMMSRFLTLVNTPNGIGVRLFDTLADAVGYNFPAGSVLCYVRGLLTKLDGQGGFWLYDPADATAVDGYSILALTSPGVTGRLLKQM